MGRIEVIVGCMFSGKTEELIRRLRRAQFAKQKVQVFKPQIDNRYSLEDVASHSSQKFPSIPVKSASEIMELLQDSTRIVGIDEGQFFDREIVSVVTKLANRGLRVIVAGLDMDWRGEPFQPMPELMAIAEEVCKQHAICMICGDPATRTQKLVKEDRQIQVGAADSYEARCRSCHETNLEKVQPSRGAVVWI
jgi:thymidine kinase